MTEITKRLSTALADRYKIERHLGEGGMATVYLAEDLKHHRKVAVKVLRPELSAILGGERFLKEIEVTANLQHPNILPLYDSGEADALLYYVMPYMEGESLRDKMTREKQLGVDETVEIAKAVAAALSFAHERGVVHRDIKPENILLQAGQPLVADFGIALAVSVAGGTRMTETGLSLGTPHYMSPEQAMGDRELDARSDVYSLGAMVYEMLTGDPPHHGNTAQAIVAKILSEKPSAISQTRDMVPPNVEAAVTTALAKTPADRFTSAAKFAEALTNPAFTLPSAQATAVTTAVPGSGPWNRVAITATALSTLFLLTTLWGWLRPQPEPPRPVIRYSITLAEEEVLQPLFGTSVALSPDGSLLVYAGPREEGNQLWLRERDQLHSSPLPGTEGAWQPFFSPDGQRVGFITGARELKVVSFTGEPPFAVADSGLWRNGGSWGPDGYLYVGWQQNGTVLSRIPAAGGETEPVTTLDTAQGEVNHGWPDALPNGRGVLFTAMRMTNQASENDEVAVVDLATGEHRPLVRGLLGKYLTGHLVFVRYDGSLLAAPFDQDKLVLTGPPVPLLTEMPGLAGPDLALSPSGRLVYSTSGSASGLAEVVWVDRVGGTTAIEPGWTFNPNISSGLALSPDGTRFAVSVVGSEGWDIWIKEIDGPFSRLTFEGFNIRPVWSPDGLSVMYRSAAGLSYDLWAKRADGSGPAEVLLDFDQDLGGGLWSSDGQWLVVSTDAPSNVYAIRPDMDSVPVSLLTGEFNEAAPALSPDGQWLAYVSDESGQSEVYVGSFPDVADMKRQVSTEGGMEPRWAHSGQELFYKNPARELVAATVRTDPTFAVVERRVLFTFPAGLANYVPNARYDVSRDDQRFITFRPVGIEEGSGELIVVENFLEELKAKVGN